MGLVSALYATAGQAGGSGFIAVMTFSSFPPGAIRATAFALNIVAASYASLKMHRAKLVNWRLLTLLLISSIPMAFLGGFLNLHAKAYYGFTGAVLCAVSVLILIRLSAGEMNIGRKTALAAGAATGLVSGITGVGGGVFLSTILI